MTCCRLGHFYGGRAIFLNFEDSMGSTPLQSTIEPYMTAVSFGAETLGDGEVRSFSAIEGTTSQVSPYLMSKRKRAMDVCIAAIALVLVLPILAMVALIVKITSEGPALFKQGRIGVDGTAFTIFKFRSMTNESCRNDVTKQASKNDPRVTTVGRFLRRTSIDELPQLLNVLSGDMSLIGPRPHAILHDQYYVSKIPLYKKRLAARPGITGLAQVSGARGPTPRLADMERRVALDCEYVRTASMLGDLRLLLATAKEMLMSEAAL